MFEKNPLKTYHRNLESGVGKITTLVFGALIIATVYAGFKIAPLYYYYFELQGQMEGAVRVASMHTDSQIRQKLEKHMRKLGIPAASEDLHISRTGSVMYISLKYKEELFIPFRGKDYRLHTFYFHPKAEGEY